MEKGGYIGKQVFRAADAVREMIEIRRLPYGTKQSFFRIHQQQGIDRDTGRAYAHAV
jgi:hypothetical protein